MKSIFSVLYILILINTVLFVPGCGCLDQNDNQEANENDKNVELVTEAEKQEDELKEGETQANEAVENDSQNGNQKYLKNPSNITESEIADFKNRGEKFLGEKSDLESADIVTTRYQLFFGIPCGAMIEEPKNKNINYSRMYYLDNVVIRADLCIKGECNIRHLIYYNEDNNPVFAAEFRGEKYIGSHYQYDNNGYLRRIVKLDIFGNLSSLSVFKVKKGYTAVLVEEYIPVEGKVTLWSKYLYRTEGTWSSSLKDKWNEKKISTRTFIDYLLQPEESGYQPLLSIPDIKITRNYLAQLEKIKDDKEQQEMLRLAETAAEISDLQNNEQDNRLPAEVIAELIKKPPVETNDCEILYSTSISHILNMMPFPGFNPAKVKPQGYFNRFVYKNGDLIIYDDSTGKGENRLWYNSDAQPLLAMHLYNGDILRMYFCEYDKVGILNRIVLYNKDLQPVRYFRFITSESGIEEQTVEAGKVVSSFLHKGSSMQNTLKWPAKSGMNPIRIKF